jgi:hypothetical protein
MAPVYMRNPALIADFWLSHTAVRTITTMKGEDDD